MEIKIEAFIFDPVYDRLKVSGEIIIRPSSTKGYIEFDGCFLKAEDLRKALNVADEPLTNPY